MRMRTACRARLDVEALLRSAKTIRWPCTLLYVKIVRLSLKIAISPAEAKAEPGAFLCGRREVGHVVSALLDPDGAACSRSAASSTVNFA